MNTSGGDQRSDRGQSLPGRVFSRMVGSVVPPIVDQLDVDDVVDRIDINELLDRVDIEAIIDRVDFNAVLDRIDPDRLLDRIDANRLLDRVEPDRLLDRVEPDRLLDRVEPDRLLDRVDANRLIDRVDTDRLLARVDVNEIVQRTELGAIIARSTTGVFGQLVDAIRTQLMAVDQVAQGVAGRVLRRSRREIPGTPSDPTDQPEFDRADAAARAVALQGHHAGSVSRFLAFLVDQFFIGVLFGLGTALVDAAIEVVLGRTVSITDHRLLVTVAYLSWAFLYLAVPLALAGRTVGKALLGLMVVERDGGDLSWRGAAVRTIVFPLSFFFFGAGLLIGLVRRDRRELHDLIAGTAVIYAWDAQTAQLRARRITEERNQPVDTSGGA